MLDTWPWRCMDVAAVQSAALRAAAAVERDALVRAAVLGLRGSCGGAPQQMETLKLREAGRRGERGPQSVKK